MNYSPAQILQMLLTEASDAPFTAPELNLDWPLYIASMPDKASVPNVGCIYDTSPDRLGRLMDGTELWRLGFQIKVRSSSYRVGWDQAEEVSAQLEVIHNALVSMESGAYFTIDSISQTSRVLSLGQDEQRRSMFTINGLVMFGEEGLVRPAKRSPPELVGP